MSSANVLSHISSFSLVRNEPRRIAPSTLDALRSIPLIDVIAPYVKLRRAGKSFVGRCPFHQDRTPSFSVDPSKQLFFCHGCGIGGDAIAFIQGAEKCDFRQAVTILAARSGIAVLDGIADSRALAIRTELRDIDRRIGEILSREQILAANWLDRLRQMQRACDLENMPLWIYDELRRADCVYVLVAFGRESDAVEFLCASPARQSQIVGEILECGCVHDDHGYRLEVCAQ